MRLKTVYKRLYESHGRQVWWPAETPFEVMVGAILTQNTAWTNVEKAIDNLKRANMLCPRAMLSCRQSSLASKVKPSGYFNIKAKRLRNFCEWYISEGEYTNLKKYETDTLRAMLLSVNGVGPETADDILLYAFNRKIFVVDAYTRRIFSRLGVVEKDIGYESLRACFEKQLSKESTELFNEYHALIVLHGKDVCKTKPLCEKCCLSKHCRRLHL